MSAARLPLGLATPRLPGRVEELVLPTMSDVLEFAGVGVTRGGSQLLTDITWSVEEGERWVVIGPNGAGKTTLLQVASARMHPTTGVAGILGEVLGTVDVFELRPRIGLSSAALAERIPDEERVSDVVVTASWGVTGRWREEYEQLDTARAGELLAALGVAQLAARRYGTLSEGERKRVQIARALMTDPELMLLDEPAAGLDLRGREDLVGRLQVLAQDLDAPAMVLVTHHVEEIPPGFTDILMLRKGRTIAAGPLEVTLTAANLSATFDLPLVVDRHGDRWAARAASPVG
jgi:iron complex transport system ATP-binding protein